MEGVGAGGLRPDTRTGSRFGPDGHMATPEDVTDAVAWLIEGGRIGTGTQLVTDGGIALGL